MLNDKTAKLISEEERYPGGANSPTIHSEYECPCGKGRVVSEHVVGFGDYIAWLECGNCEPRYSVVTGRGHFWELCKK